MVMMTWIIQTFVASILYLTTFVKSANIFRVTNRPLKVITWVRLDETVQCNLEVCLQRHQASAAGCPWKVVRVMKEELGVADCDTAAAPVPPYVVYYAQMLRCAKYLQQTQQRRSRDTVNNAERTVLQQPLQQIAVLGF